MSVRMAGMKAEIWKNDLHNTKLSANHFTWNKGVIRPLKRRFDTGKWGRILVGICDKF